MRYFSNHILRSTTIVSTCVAAAILTRIFALVFRRVIRLLSGSIALARTSEIVRCQAVLKARFIDKSYKFGVFVALVNYTIKCNR